jgi:hypothetical protein
MRGGTKAYRMYDSIGRRVHITCDVVFDEAAKWDLDREEDAGAVSDFSIEYMVFSTMCRLEEPEAMEAVEQEMHSPAGGRATPPHAPGGLMRNQQFWKIILMQIKMMLLGD